MSANTSTLPLPSALPPIQINRKPLWIALLLVLHAQTHAKGFYEAHGFQVEGEEFMEAGIAHVVMTRVLA